MKRFIQYVKDTRGEMRHVSWPTQTQTLIYTALVVAISLLTAMYLGFFDFIFTSSLNEGLDAIAPGRDTGIQQEVTTPTDMPGGNGQQPAFDFGGAETGGGQIEVEETSPEGTEATDSGNDS